MSTTLKRTSMALDEATRNYLEELSHEWGVSKAEVVRRSIAKAKEKLEEEPNDRAQAIQKRIAAATWLQENGISHEVAEKFKQELKAIREADRDPWAEYEASRH